MQTTIDGREQRREVADAKQQREERNGGYGFIGGEGLQPRLI
jgi:hypothetical protein